MLTINKSDRRSNDGFTLIEVLIAVILMSVGLLGMLSMQLQGLGNTNNSYFRTQATILGTDIVERMRANQEGVYAGNYDTINTDTTYSAVSGNCSASCSIAQLATQDIFEWTQNFAGASPRIPGATATVANSGDNTFTVTINWTERGFKAADDATGAQLEDEIQTHTITAIIQ